MTLPTDKELSAIKENLRHENGVLWWTRPGNSRVLSAPVGSLCNGYIRVQLSGKVYCAHKLVWFLEYGHWPDSLIDHIDGSKSNNHHSNLRLANTSLNGANRKKNAAKKGRYKGVYFDKSSGNWRARIMVNKVSVSLGNFDNEDAAADAYDRHARLAFGSFAKTNKAQHA